MIGWGLERDIESGCSAPTDIDSNKCTTEEGHCTIGSNLVECVIADARQRPISCLPRPDIGRIVLNAEVEPVMAGVCDICGKTKSFGHNVSHSKRRTNRDFRPNVQRKRMIVGNELVRLNVCTRCMRTAQKGGRSA
ncbi:MAG: 50S ribosomal protein L28 [Thermomicrobiales bacterium]